MAPIYSQFRSIPFFALIFIFITFALGRDIDSSISTRAVIPSDNDISDALYPAPNKSWFWSGRRGACASDADSVIGLALSLAVARNGVTLEKLLDDAGVQMPAFDNTDAAAEAAWDFATRAYVQQTSGYAFVVLGTCRTGNIWETVELPGLQNGGNVNCIFQFTEADNWTNPQLLWAADGQEVSCRIVTNNRAALFGRAFTA